MSPVGHALQERFGSVCRSELERLRKKTASLAPEHRAEVHALSLEVAQRMALRLEAALASSGGGDLAGIVTRLFAVTPAHVEDRK
jgi:glutamyl-tRNAGlu reductase-like protein